MALSAVVLPAPFGPINPRMRPSSTRRSTPSSATVAPKALRRPLASMQAITLSFLSGGFRRRQTGRAVEQFVRTQSEALNGGTNPGPLFRKKLPAFAFKEQTACAAINEHASAAPGFHQP